ncbi:helix-hairpin-helix domain-containing protein [Halorubrum ejinorense]|uniref:Helix-hairpin-helix domain-containing protein n=1 Tax=Halorubrum ejinorense TaxID=425309 RepID=A0AAV3SRA9_9EURY
MASEDLNARTDVVTLADHVDGLGESVARRLDDNGIETVADILITERKTLTDIPYVSETRVDLLQETAERVAGDDVEPREVDFNATESVVSEADEHEEDPLASDPVADALDVGLGEKVELVTEDGNSWSKPWCVVDVDDPVSWTAPLGEDFETRTITVRTSPQSGKQYDLLVTGDEVWMAGEYNGRPYRRLWRVAQVNPVGRIAEASYYQLVGQQQEQETRPEGDDTWRQYQNRGETA